MTRSFEQAGFFFCFQFFFVTFSARRYASARYLPSSCVSPSIYPFVCASVTSRYYIEATEKSSSFSIGSFWLDAHSLLHVGRP